MNQRAKTSPSDDMAVLIASEFLRGQVVVPLFKTSSRGIKNFGLMTFQTLLGYLISKISLVKQSLMNHQMIRKLNFALDLKTCRQF